MWVVREWKRERERVRESERERGRKKERERGKKERERKEEKQREREGGRAPESHPLGLTGYVFFFVCVSMCV